MDDPRIELEQALALEDASSRSPPSSTKQCSRRERVREDVRRLVAGLPKPYRRERPRDPEEARLLRERGTPERLIGPERE